jgi:AcrR family transcriptional regulator
MPTATRSARPLRHPGRPEEILEAACKAIVARGFAQTRVADIAQAAGTSTGTIHYYFESREEVLVEALRWASERLFARLSAPADAAPLARLGRLLELSIPYSDPKERRDEYVLWLETWTLVLHDRARMRAVEDLSRRWRGIFSDTIDSGTTDGTFRPVSEPSVVAERLIALVDGLGFETAIGYPWATTERMRALLLDFACEQLGISARKLDQAMTAERR